MSAQERCLQTKTGSCMGCNVQEILIKRISRNGTQDPVRIAAEVASEYCPKETQIQVPVPEKSVL